MTYAEILKTRGLDVTEVKSPLWTLKTTDVEYASMKQTLWYASQCSNLESSKRSMVCSYAKSCKRDYYGKPCKAVRAGKKGKKYDRIWILAGNE